MGCSDGAYQFVKSELSFTNPKTKEDDIKYEMIYRPLHSWIDSIMSNSTLLPLCQFDAVKVEQYDSSSSTFDRHYNEPWTGDAWWEAQVCHSALGANSCSNPQPKSKLQDNAGIFAIILNADKTKLSSFGTQKGYPIYARCGNLPLRIRNGVKHGKEMLAGLIPVVCLVPSSSV